MKAEFWHNKWERNEIGFHQSEINPFLKKHIDKLELSSGSRIFLPLCGKTRDIAWLLSEGYTIVGVELSELAIEALFEDLKLTPNKVKTDDFIIYNAKNITIYTGDFFKLSTELLGDVDAVFDRAALVALPDDLRISYAQHIVKITQYTPQLLVTFQYDQSLMSGPPFSISSQHLKSLYQSSFAIKSIETVALEGGFRGKISATESAWLLAKTK